MGFTLTRNSSNSVAGTLRSPEQELANKLNHDHMSSMSLNPPISIGSEKQIKWAKAIASQFLFHAHAWGFKAEQIDRVFANHGKYAKFWIDNRNPSGNSGEGVTRIAVENLLANLDAESTALAKSQAEIAAMPHAQINKKIGRGLR